MKISAAELDVMSVLWQRPGLAASDVHESLGDEKDWTSRTVKTLLARLVEKGALRTEEDGRRYLYYPIIEEDAYKAKAAGSVCRPGLLRPGRPSGGAPGGYARPDTGRH